MAWFWPAFRHPGLPFHNDDAPVRNEGSLELREEVRSILDFVQDKRQEYSVDSVISEGKGLFVE